MNLYLISQTERDDYDTYDAAVVAAESEADACKIHPHGDESWDFSGVWASTPELVTARLIGVAAADVQRGIVLASFNAG